jgi:membrane protease YdiL (CAAX protease family)
MLKMREPAEQQMGEPTELLTQRQSLVRRILMFPLTRLLIAAIVFELVVISVAILAITAMLILGQLHLVDLFVGSLSSTSNDSSPMSLILIFGLLALAGIITLVFMGKVVEQRSLAEVGLGLRGLLRYTLKGFGIGTGMLLLLILMTEAAVLLGLVSEAESTLSYDYFNLALQQMQQTGGVFGYLGLAFVFAWLVAVCEEIVFRGLLFRILEEGLGSWLALAISSLAFSMAHLGNFEDPTLLSVASQTAGGVAFAAAYMLTRKLWLPIAIHWGWDFAIFGISPEALLTLDDASTASVSALTSLIISIPDLVLAIVLLTLVIRRGQIRTPCWMQRKRTHKKPYVDENAAPLL